MFICTVVLIEPKIIIWCKKDLQIGLVPSRSCLCLLRNMLVKDPPNRATTSTPPTRVVYGLFSAHHSIHHLKHTLPILAGGGENPLFGVYLPVHIFCCNDLDEEWQEGSECNKRGSKDPTQELSVLDYMPILLLIGAVLVENVSECE